MSQTETPQPSPDNIPVRGENINLEDMKPLNDPNCEHEFVREATSEIPNTYTELCRKCPIGRIVKA